MNKLRMGILGLLVGLLWGCQAAQDGAVPPILYLSWDGNGRTQLYRITNDKEPIQLTQSETNIIDFAPSPDGRRIAYTTGDALWLINRSASQELLNCAPDQCNHIVWHPDSRRLLYERTAPGRSSRLWWLDSASGKTVALLEDGNIPSEAARFSAAGEWVSYFIASVQEIAFYHFEDGRTFQIPANQGTAATWHPSEPIYLYNNQQIIIYHGDEGDEHDEHSHDYAVSLPLLRGDTAVEGIMPTILSEIEATDDASPAWSPNGEWIVFGRKLPGVENGRQLWRIRVDGREAEALTDDPLVHHGVPSWSGDGRYLLYQRYDTQDPVAHPSIWLLEIATGTMTEITPAGFLPHWQG